MSKEIPLTQGKFALVDDEDYEELNKYKWYAYKSKDTYYARRTEYPSGKTILMHRVVTNAPKDLVVDHKNGDGLDNRKLNVRICTLSENARNSKRSSNNKSGYKCVYWHKQHRKWVAHLRIDGKMKHLGLFKTAHEAAKAHDKKALELRKEFAYLNFKEENK